MFAQNTALLAETHQQILAATRNETTPLMLFGSVARGDASPESDIDVLEVVERRRRPYRVDRVNVSAYDEATLRRMAERGSLFVLHLRLEGRALRDPENKLRDCLDAYSPPRSYDGFRRALRDLGNLLDVERDEYERHWQSYNELVLYIIRSELYARFAEAGQPVFSLGVVKQRANCDDINRVLSLKAEATPNWPLFADARRVISDLLAASIKNIYGSTEALITNAGEHNSLLMAFGLRILGSERLDLSYDLLTVPPFA